MEGSPNDLRHSPKWIRPELLAPPGVPLLLLGLGAFALGETAPVISDCDFEVGLPKQRCGEPMLDPPSDGA